MTDPGRIDEELAGITAAIVHRAGLASPELTARLSSEQVRVVKGVPGGTRSFSVAHPKTVVILVGAELYPLYHQYTSAVAAFMLPSEPAGPRPSALWPAARDALAVTIDWVGSPAPTPRFPPIELSPNQAHAAHVFAVYLYRFELCRQLGHVVAEHIAPPGDEDPRAVTVLRATEEQESVADAIGLELQIMSLPDDTQLVNGLASSAYHIAVTAAVERGRELRGAPAATLLPGLPPATARSIVCRQTAERLAPGLGAGVQSVVEQLSWLGEAVHDQVERARDATRAAVLSRVQAIDPDDPGQARAARVALLEHLDRSPLGVLLGLGDDGRRSEALLADLPERARFLRLSEADQATHYALH